MTARVQCWHLARCLSPEREMGKKSSAGKMQSLKGRQRAMKWLWGEASRQLGEFVRGGHWWRVCCAFGRAWDFTVENVPLKRATQESRAGSSRPEQITAVMIHFLRKLGCRNCLLTKKFPGMCEGF